MNLKRVAGTGFVVVILLNILAAIVLIGGLWWAWNHVISPSFDVPQLQVK